MRRADRLLQMIQILRRHRRPVTGEKMAEELRVSLRTIYRDISELIMQGVPIQGEAGIGYVLNSGYDLPPLMFNADELEAIMLGLRWVTRKGDDMLVRAAMDSAAKIGAVLPEKLKPLLFESTLLVPPYLQQCADKVSVADIRACIRARCKVEISYRDEHLQETRRKIWPIAIAYFEAQRLVIGWCELRAAFRSFRTDRIMSITYASEKYPERQTTLLRRWQQELPQDLDCSKFDILL